VLDLHGMSNKYKIGLALGTMNGRSCPYHESLILQTVEKQYRPTSQTVAKKFPALRWDRRYALRKCTEAAVFRVLAARARPRLAAAGIAFADRVIGMHQTGRVDEAYACDVIARLSAGTTELYCHPARGRAPATAPYQVGYRNDEELTTLTSPLVRAALESAGVTLARYPDLTSARR